MDIRVPRLMPLSLQTFRNPARGQYCASVSRCLQGPFLSESRWGLSSTGNDKAKGLSVANLLCFSQTNKQKRYRSCVSSCYLGDRQKAFPKHFNLVPIWFLNPSGLQATSCKLRTVCMAFSVSLETDFGASVWEEFLVLRAKSSERF